MELPCELIQAIVVKLPLRDVVNCMCICKKWRDVITADSFWKNYALHWFNFSLEEGPTGILEEWQNDWFCYWYNAELEAGWEPTVNERVFHTPPKRWEGSGIIHPASFDINQQRAPSYKYFFKCVQILQKISKGIQEYDLECRNVSKTVCPHCSTIAIVASENESSSSVEVCLFPWEKEQLPGSKDVGTLFAFDEHMCSEGASKEEKEAGPLKLETDEDDDQLCLGKRIVRYPADNSAARSYMEWLQKLFVPSVMIIFGMEQMNPVPFFILTRLAPGWVGGFMTSITCT